MEKDFQDTIQTLRGDNESLAKENLSLRRQIGGYLTSKTRYKHEIQRLKALNVEADEMYEKKIAELEEKRRVMDGLTHQVRDLIAVKNEMEANLVAKDKAIADLETEIAQLKRPWYKKWF